MQSSREFVIQKHIKASNLHWDLMLEAGNVLETYRLELPLEKLMHQRSPAIRIFDHPLKFLTYEGSVNKGKGTVEIAERGTCQLLRESKHKKEFQFEGKILKGKFSLTNIKDNRWEFRRSE
ncbi:MAG: DNA polymerase ligase N-terminal domain-containing protein [Planctomycetota bacterium]|jgi:bifunctional non-homologous end joining protein LigD